MNQLVLSHNENEESNTIDTGGEGEQVLAYNRATHNNLFFLSFLISIILTVSSVWTFKYVICLLSMYIIIESKFCVQILTGIKFKSFPYMYYYSEVHFFVILCRNRNGYTFSKLTLYLIHPSIEWVVQVQKITIE